MLARPVLVAAALAVCGSQTAALPVRVVLDWPSGSPVSAPARARIQIQAHRMAGPSEGGAPVEAEAGPDGGVIDLGEGVWQVQASAFGSWSAAAEIVVGEQTPVSVRLALWPAAWLHGEVLMAVGDPLPRDIEIRLSAVPAADETTVPPAPGQRVEPSPARAELRCRIDEQGAWSCLGPAGLFDVKLEAASYAPRYAWDVKLAAAASTDLGQTVLRRAASVFGRAVRSDGSNPQGPCRATLRANLTPRGALASDPGAAPEAEAGLSAPLSPRGYFHVVGVPPGGQDLSVECPAASATRELRVPSDGELRIDPPLLLEELTLDVVVSPRVDPEGRPWRLTVDATAPRFRPIARKATPSEDGRWARRGLTAGSYRVALESSDGTRWLQRFFELNAGSRPLSLRLPFVGVTGRVQLSTRPLRARLLFYDELGGEPATVTSDDDGRFQGLLPVAPDALETRWTVEVQAAQPPIRRRLERVRVRSEANDGSAWLELALPLAAVRGTVVSESGEPQSGARVTVEVAGGGTRTITATDDAGGFELAELPPGSYTAVAESVGSVSEPTSLEVLEGVESELQLVLDRSERVSFYVVGSQGPVADAAVQVWIAPGVPRGFKRTDAEGRVELDLPPGTTEVGLTIGAPGQALKLTRLQIANEQTINLGVSGGTLVLDLQPPGRVDDGSTTPYLVHDGAIEAAGGLAGWGTAEHGGGPVVIDSIEPGVYALCLAGPEELASLWRGELSPGRCRTGSVEQGRRLTLALP